MAKEKLSLWKKLEGVLPKVLPESPNFIKGTELVDKILENLEAEENPKSIQVYLSNMLKDPTSLIAKRADGQGYYRRPAADQIIENLTESQAEKAEITAKRRDEQREEKFRSIFKRYLESGDIENSNTYAMTIEHTKGKKTQRGANKWKYPDVILLEWRTLLFEEDGFNLNQSALDVAKSLGEQPFKIVSVELKPDLSYSNYREYFFQCVSNSKWAHEGRLVIAAEIKEGPLLTELMRLGKSYGINIMTYGLNGDDLDNLLNAKDIESLPPEKFKELVSSKITVKPISTGAERDNLDWAHIEDLREQIEDFKQLFDWISFCLSRSKAHPYSDFVSFKNLDQKPETRTKKRKP